MSLTAHEKLSMFVNLKKGDTILTGRFKNSPKTVKSFGTDDKNQPTVNGSPALSFRIKKLMPAKAKESAVLLPIEQRLIRLNARRIASDKTASVFPWFMTTGGALAGGSAGAALGRQIGENMSDSRTGRRIGTIAGGLLGALGGGYAGYRLAPAFGIEEALGAGPRTGTYGDVMRRGGLLGAMSGAATGGITGGLEGAVTGGLTGIPLGIGIGALSRYAADRSYGSTPGSRRKVVPGEFFGTAPKMSYYKGVYPNFVNKQEDKKAVSSDLVLQAYRNTLKRGNPVEIAARLQRMLVNNIDRYYNKALAKQTGRFYKGHRPVSLQKTYDIVDTLAPELTKIKKSPIDVFQQEYINRFRTEASPILKQAKSYQLTDLFRNNEDPFINLLYPNPTGGKAAYLSKRPIPGNPFNVDNYLHLVTVPGIDMKKYGGVLYKADRLANHITTNPYIDKRSSAFPLFSTLTGATLGGVTGAGIGMHAQSGRFTTPRDRYRNMLIGGVLGAGLGGVGGYYAAPYGRMEEALVAPAMVGTPADAVARGIMTGGFSGGIMSGLQRYAGEAGGYGR